MKHGKYRPADFQADPSGIRIAAGRYVKTVVADPVMYDAHVGRKIGRTGAAVGIEKEQGIVDSKQPAACHGPVHDIIMLLGRCHVIDVLRIIAAAYGFTHTDKLPCVYGNHKS